MAKTQPGIRDGSDLKIVIHEPQGKVHGPQCACMVCPHCGATEVDDCRKPSDQWKWQIRPFKVDNASHCLVCDKWFTTEVS